MRGKGVLSPESQCVLHAGVCCKEENGRNKEKQRVQRGSRIYAERVDMEKLLGKLHGLE